MVWTGRCSLPHAETKQHYNQFFILRSELNEGKQRKLELLGTNMGEWELPGSDLARHILLGFFSLTGSVPNSSLHRSQPPADWGSGTLPEPTQFTGRTHTQASPAPSMAERSLSCCPHGARWAGTCTAAVGSGPASSGPPPAPAPSSASPPGRR